MAASTATGSVRDEAEALRTAEAFAYDGGRPELGSGGLRQRTARGTLINAAFRIGLAGLTLLQRTAVAAFLTPEELGIWGAVLVTLVALFFLKNSAIGDKYIQQSEDDQEVAFQKAFTFEFAATSAFLLLAGASLPVFAVAYDSWEIVLPGLVLLIAGFGNALKAPVWIFYRQMDFLRQRKLDAVDPVVAFVATIALAAAGLGYWSLVVGAVLGAWSGAAVALRACPYTIKPRLDRVTARDYFSFSWPLFIAGSGAIVIAQGSVLAGSHAVGIAGVGAISLAVSVSTFAAGANAIVTETLYPAICAVQNRLDLLKEAFVKSNRLALMWAVPFGLGLSLFASDLVHYVFGDRWESAIILLQAFGVMVAIDQLGFNWAAFLRARNETKPIAIVSVVTAVTFVAITVPLLFIDGLHGYAAGMLAVTVVTVVARSVFLARLFSGFQMIWHAARAIAPSVIPVVLVLGLRALESGDRTSGMALAELGVYVVATVAATLLLERALLKEVLSYLRPKGTVTPKLADEPAVQ